VLNLPMGENELDAVTVGDYLRCVDLHEDPDARRELYAALVVGGAVEGGYVDGLVEPTSTERADAVLLDAVRRLNEVSV
jgi:hypothetical protein